LINRIDDFICGRRRGESSQWLPHLEVDPYLHSPCHIAIYALTFFPLTHNLLHTASHSSPSHTHINGCLTFVPLTHSLTFITLSLTFVPLTHSLTFVVTFCEKKFGAVEAGRAGTDADVVVPVPLLGPF